MNHPLFQVLAVLCLFPAAAALGKPAAPPVRDERFGVMTHFAQGWSPALIPLIAGGSIFEIRDELYWDRVEAGRGSFDFPPQYDAVMEALGRNSVSPLVVLDFGNRNYDGGAAPCSADACAGYARYAVRLLGRYGRRIGAVEVWNEYNGSFCTGPAAGNRPAAYLRMLRPAYAAIKAARPDVTVVAGATSGVPLPYWKKLLDGGLLESADALSVHPYRYDSPPEGIERDIARLQALVMQHNHGRPRPIWVTEIGWYTKASQAPGDLAIDEATQAKFLVRAYALLLSAGVGRVYWYDFRDEPGLPMGLVRADAAGTPKPAFTALTTLARQLGGARFVGRDPTPDDLYSLEFRRTSGEPVRVLWSLQPRTLVVSGANEVVDIAGRSFGAASSLVVGDSPVFVAGPLAGLPSAPRSRPAILADSERDFAPDQGGGGWFYGTSTGSDPTFTPLPKFQVTDWTESWTGPQPYVELTATDQHPSASGSVPVSAVRRWRSNYEGRVRITGRFLCSILGDGVGVSIRVDGKSLYRRLIGGGGGRPILDPFDVVQRVHPGTCVDFAVDPGPAANIDFDATNVKALISACTP